jgi:leucyl-tRNA synthetase
LGPTPPEEIERLALASERVQVYLKGRAPRKVLHVPGRLVNIVTPE